MKVKIILLISSVIVLFAFNTEKKQWVAIGDSITYLNDHPEQTGNRITTGYMTLVAQQRPNLSFVNQGHNGWTACRIAEKINTLGIVKADIYTIFLGTNDWWQGKPIGTVEDYDKNTGYETFYGSFRIILDYLKALNPRAQVILLTPMQRVDFVYFRNFKNNAYGSYKAKNGQMLAQFAEAVEEIASKERYQLIDLYHEKKLSHKKLVHFKRIKNLETGEYTDYTYPAFTNIPFSPEQEQNPYPVEAMAMTYDGLHPSDKGYQVIAKKLLKLLK